MNLADRYALVVLDNCEHVVDAARAVAGAIRAGCDKVRLLATSREALGLRGEHAISLSSLPGVDAIGLFCTRAGEARAGLVFDDATLAAIDEVCVRLDGIPLAIELAAARCRSMPRSRSPLGSTIGSGCCVAGAAVYATELFRPRWSGRIRCSTMTSVRCSIGWRCSPAAG